MTTFLRLKLVFGFALLATNYFAQNNTATNHYIGELYGGGVVFHTYLTPDGSTHGLIVAMSDVAKEAKWGPITVDVESAESTWDGQANTSAIMMGLRDTTNAAGLCDKFIQNEFNDWYLPAVFELGMLWANLYDVNRVLSGQADSAQISQSLYWSSSESNEASAWFFSFFDGKPSNYYDKSSLTFVRPIRAF